MAEAAAAAPAGKARALPPHELAAKVHEYEAFANDVLKHRLQTISARRTRLEAEREELAELQRSVATLRQEERSELKSLVDLGSGVFCQAHVPDISRIHVSVGLGFHLECTLEEADGVVERRREALKAQIDACVQEAAQVRTHIRFVVQAICELQQLGRTVP